MKTTDYTKARKAVDQRWTEKRVINNLSPEAVAIWQKIIARQEANKPAKTVKEFTDELIKKRLDAIAFAMPNENYSMGSNIRVQFLGLGRGIMGSCDTRGWYSGRNYRPTHGGYLHRVNLDELVHTQIIGGLVTYIYPNQKSRVKKCWWYSRYGEKQYFKLEKAEGYVYAGYHSLSKDGALRGGKRNISIKKAFEKTKKQREKNKLVAERAFRKALRCQYSYQDSLDAGNCEVGTKAFIMRCGLSREKKYRGSFLLKIAEEKSTSSVSYVNKMIRYRAAKK